MVHNIKKANPYWNCTTNILEKKARKITALIYKINTSSVKELNLVESENLTELLYELRRSIHAQIELRSIPGQFINTFGSVEAAKAALDKYEEEHKTITS